MVTHGRASVLGRELGHCSEISLLSSGGSSLLSGHHRLLLLLLLLELTAKESQLNLLRTEEIWTHLIH